LPCRGGVDILITCYEANPHWHVVKHVHGLVTPEMVNPPPAGAPRGIP